MQIALTTTARPSTCAVCKGGLQGASWSCPDCGTALHDDCAASLGRCPTLGCWEGTPARRLLDAARRPRTLRRALLATLAAPLLFAGGWWLADQLESQPGVATIERREEVAAGPALPALSVESFRRTSVVDDVVSFGRPRVGREYQFLTRLHSQEWTPHTIRVTAVSDVRVLYDDGSELIREQTLSDRLGRGPVARERYGPVTRERLFVGRLRLECVQVNIDGVEHRFAVDGDRLLLPFPVASRSPGFFRQLVAVHDLEGAE